MLLNSKAFDGVLLFKRRYKIISQQTDENTIFDEQQSVRLNRLLHGIFDIINNLDRTVLKNDIFKYFFLKNTDTAIDSDDFNDFNDFDDFENLINTLKQQIADNRIENVLRDLSHLLRYRKQINIILFKVRFNTFKRERNLGLLTTAEEQKFYTKMGLNILSYIDGLKKRDFKKDIFKK